MEEITRLITETDEESAEKKNSDERELQQEDNVHTLELDEERYRDYGGMMDDACCVYGCGGAEVKRLDEKEEMVKSEDKPCKCKKVNFKKMFALKDAVIGVLFSGLLIVSKTIPISAVSTAVILFFTMAFTVSVGLFVTDNLFVKWLKGR